MAELLSLDVQDFYSLGEVHLPLVGRGLLRLEGRNLDASAANDNGAGKSSLPEALAWCLYGRTLRDGVGADDVVRIGAKQCSVSVMFRAEGIHYRAARERTKGKTRLSLFGADADLTCLDIVDTQARITALLGMDLLTFVNAVVYDRAELTRFSNAADADRKRILEGLLGIDIYERCHEVAKRRYAEVEVEERQTQAEVQWAEQAAGTARKDIEEQRTASERWEETRLSELAALDGRLGGYEGVVARMRQAETQVAASRAEAKAKQDLRFAKQTEVGEELARLQGPVATLTQQINGLDVELEQIDSVGVGACPHCRQPVTAEHLAETRRVYMERRAQLAPKYEKAQASLVKVQQASRRVITEIEAAYQEAHRRAEEQARLYHQEMAEVRRLEALKAERAAKAKQASPHVVALIQAKGRLQRALEQREALAGRSETMAAKREVLRFWVTAYGRGGIRSYLLDEVTPRLNERANAVAQVLTGGDLEISFSTTTSKKDGGTSEKFSLSVSNRHGARVYGGNSEGEKRRADLCVLFALHELARSKVGNLGLLFLDEVFDVLDDAGVERVSSFLQEITGEVGTVFVITHNAGLSDLIPGHVTVQKRGGLSSLLGT